MSDKEAAIEAIRKLPDTASMEEISEDVAILASLRRAKQASDAGRGTRKVKADRKPAFPRGSLLKYLTSERDKEQLAILSGCVQTPPKPG
jgi:hypothetical protein